ncbi:MAG: rod shape-determining protein MreD [Methylococcaceae bacterium]|nr:MAG: rod shape-determining protein MreD [Methylococcaceae bacterium]
MNDSSYGVGKIILSLFLAMCLRVLPLPPFWADFNPDWVLLTLIYWSLAIPERVGIFHAWVFGVLIDVLTGRLLGQNALAYSIVVYLCLKLHKRLRQFPLLQQELYIFICLLLSQLLLFLIKNLQNPEQLHSTFWLPVLTGTLCWPLVYTVLRFVRLTTRLKS